MHRTFLLIALVAACSAEDRRSPPPAKAPAATPASMAVLHVVRVSAMRADISLLPSFWRSF